MIPSVSDRPLEDGPAGVGPLTPRRPAHPILRFVRGVAWAFYGISVPIVLWPGLLLLFRAETVAGHLFGLGVVVLFSLPPAGLYARFVRRVKDRDGRLPAAILAALLPIILAVLCALSPTGESIPGSGVSSHFISGSSYFRFSPWNLLPEIDQVKLGIEMMPFFSPIDRQVPPSLMDITMPIYRPMEADPAFRSLGSVMNLSYGEFAGAHWDSGHFYEYVPPHKSAERLGLLIFLHGSIGNFKGYLWAWKPFADREKLVVLCPTFGLGNWYRPGAVEAIERVREYALKSLPIDEKRIWLAGLSSGGIGVTLGGAAHPSHFAGLILLSGVQKEKFVFDPRFLDGQKGRPILIIHGAKDHMVSPMETHSGAEAMRKAGIVVTEKTYLDEDHYLFYGSRERVYSDVAEWMQDVEGAAD